MRSVNINASYAQASKETVRKLVNTQSLFARTGSAGTVATGLEASESNWSRSREREYLSYVQCALGSVIDGIVISRGKREIRNNSFKTDLEVMDLKYMSPQITMLQQMLIDVSSCYRPGNFATPGPLSLMTHAMLKDRLVNDFPRRASQTKNMTLANIARTFSKSNLRLDKGFKGGAAPDADSSSFYDNNVAEGNNEPKGVIRDARLSPHGNDRYLWVKDLFESLVDEEGNLDYEDVCGGFSLLGIPISLEEAEELVEEGDPFNTGVLSLEKIGVLCDRVILVDDMVRGLQREWGQSTFYMQRDLQGGTFMEKITKALVDTKQMQRCIMTARMQDPASRPVSFVPYRIEECFYDDEVHRRSETVQSTKQKVSVNGSSSSKKPPAFISQRDLQRRMDSPDPAISLFTRLPLHFACANSSNPEAGQMVRDVLCSYGGAARIADRKGRLPLHVAAMNESFACVTMVKLLLEEYPDATMVPDADGELPIHLCLRHNHGDGAFQVVVFLLDARRSCAGVASGLSLKGDFPTKELPAHLAISNYCRWNHRIIRAVISAYPTALSSTDEAGATILHRFSWTPHPSPHATERALEVERGITSHLRAPRKAGEENRRFDPVKMLDELVRCSVRFNPELLHTTDMYGAMPLHYVCQNKSPCARMIANELLRLHPSASMLVDVNGNTPLHMALGSKNSAVAEVIAEQHQTNLFNVPNLRNVTPSEVRGAWQVLSLFRPPSFYGTPCAIHGMCREATFASACFSSLYLLPRHRT
jgi:ankyrin repeat protein